MTPDERLIAEIEMWQVRAAAPLFPAGDISQLIDLVRSEIGQNSALEQTIRHATDNRTIASLAYQALHSVNREWARDTIEMLDSERAYVAQMLNNMRVIQVIGADRENQKERERLAAEIRAFAEQRRNAGKAPKRRKWAELLAEHISCWDDIPESYRRLEFFDDSNVPLQFYQSIDDKGRQIVCCVDADADKPAGKPLTRASFEKRYLKK
ncbi:hypothetical protein [Mesorhizobium caraganae]|uniref:hypothetical protein n=1 Tax=Mesorhizobium caraganae TaxID=483206 RepID=UPI003ED14438